MNQEFYLFTNYYKLHLQLIHPTTIQLHMNGVTNQSSNILIWIYEKLKKEACHLSDRMIVRKKVGIFPMRAYPARIPFRGINVVTGFGTHANIRTNGDLIVDTAARLIVRACDEMYLVKPDINVVLALLRRRKFRYNGESVHDDDIIHTLECMHIYCELKLNYDKLKEEWKSEFTKTVIRNQAPNDRLMVNGSAFDLFCRLLASFGGFDNNFRELHAKAVLRNCADNNHTITAEQFSTAMERSVREITTNGMSVPRPEVVKTLLFESGYRAQPN